MDMQITDCNELRLYTHATDNYICKKKEVTLLQNREGAAIPHFGYAGAEIYPSPNDRYSVKVAHSSSSVGVASKQHKQLERVSMEEHLLGAGEDPQWRVGDLLQ